MKTLFATVIMFALCLATGAIGQEMLVGGNMEDDTAWKVSHLDSFEDSEFEFNYVAGGPAEGQGGCLEVTASGTQSTNIIFYQEVTLTGGAEYEFKGAFKDIGGSIANFWCEALYDTAAPPDTTDFGGVLIVGFNTWDGTQAGVDGTFQDDFSKGISPIFTAPGEAGVPTKVYFAINVGCWMGGSSYFFDVAIDELSLAPVGGSAVEDSRSAVADRFTLHQNYPNPFNPQTTISYTLPKASTVTLIVLDPAGREVATLVNNEKRSAGTHQVAMNAAGLPSGVYLYRLKTESFAETRKMLLVK